MSFLAFLLFLFIIFILVPLLRIFFTIYRAQHRAKKAFRQYKEQMNGFKQQADNANSHTAGWQHTAPQKKKKFDRSQGEYVEWEEVTDIETPPATPRSEPQKERDIEREPQISDAEWEEIR